MNLKLQKLYNEWRKAGEDADVNFTWDCGEKTAREDFSEYAELEKEISFEKMLELEKEYQLIDWLTVNEIKEYIQRKIKEEGFENNQIEIDFSGLASEEEVKQAASELGYNIEEGEGEGVFWVYE